jgi:hypothetical protein
MFAMPTIAEADMHHLDPSDRITATIPEFRRLSGIGRSRIYELLNAGELESIHLGARRLIVIDSYRRLLTKLQAAEVGQCRRPAEATRAARTAAPPAG